ncbi:hypothetical protein VNO77_20145 [Canavalia gladiata]|uniref:Uncharacterized protein n=1 Tax=Canavalia gladiata TaxID=3824 RepID=A0AAN9LS94_CANGL
MLMQQISEAEWPQYGLPSRAWTLLGGSLPLCWVLKKLSSLHITEQFLEEEGIKLQELSAFANLLMLPGLLQCLWSLAIEENSNHLSNQKVQEDLAEFRQHGNQLLLRDLVVRSIGTEFNNVVKDPDSNVHVHERDPMQRPIQGIAQEGFKPYWSMSNSSGKDWNRTMMHTLISSSNKQPSTYLSL